MTSTDHDDPAARIDAAIIVAGGEGRRLGLDKPEQTVGGRRLLDAALDAVAGAAVVVVGPPRTVPPGVLLTRESPGGAGPLAAVAAGLDALPAAARTIAVLAADLPEVDRGTVGALAALRARTGAPVALAEDPAGRIQYLLAVWDARALRSALAGVGDPTGRPLRTIVGADAPRLRSAVTDVDTPEDLRIARHSPAAVRRTLRRALPVLPARPGPTVDGARTLLRGPVRVALHPSGDETAAGPVAALLAGVGAHVARGPHLADTPEAFAAALRQDEADVVAIIGATGRGAAGRLREALAEAGATLLVDGVDVRPGGSILVATVPGGAVVLGLGGDPMAALLGTALLGRPVCETMTGAVSRPEDLVSLADPNPDPRWRMLPAEPDGAGRWHVPGSVATGHLRGAVDHRAILLVPPLARTGDLVERLA
ncbi:NTP transferase domain-containing protein [Tsukamurella spumae]|uniref:NTP transferase domain-containing protein n=1 Tax=Tsukamurella spumae TaxID=44753 RepID=A0A846X0D9_9ACTN|nr:NTP transferase domain-containing protein [Tsukamurella spumae]NKY17742.1 NTP transferase domain-containing protein [Tsukamurella spumae]